MKKIWINLKIPDNNLKLIFYTNKYKINKF